MYLKVLLVLFISFAPSNAVHLSPVDSNGEFCLLRRAVGDIVSSNNISQLYVVGSQKMFRDNFRDLLIILADLNKQVKFVYVNFEKYHCDIKVYEMSSMVFMYMYVLKPDNLEAYMTYIHYNVKPRTKLILVVKRCVDQNQLTEAFRILWRDVMINAIIVQQCDETVTVHAYFPYVNHQCGVYSASNIMRIGFFNKTIYKDTNRITYTRTTPLNSSLHYRNYYNTEPFYPAKVPVNLEQCGLKVGKSVWSPLVIDPMVKDEAGFEIDFLFNVERAMNIKINYNTTIDWQGRPPFLKKRIVDLVIGANFDNPSFAEFDNSHWYYPNRLLWIAPTATLYPKQDILWAIILEEYEVFLSIIILVPVAALCIFMMMKWMFRMGMYGNIEYQRFGYFLILWTLARATVDATAPRVPSISAVRLCFGLWNLICVIICCFYQTTVTSFISEPGYIKQIKTIGDIMNSNYDVLATASYLTPINETYGQKLFDRTKYKTSPSTMVTVPTALKKVSLNEAITFTDEIRAEYLSLQWIQSNGRKTLYFMTEAPQRFFYIQLTMSSGHPMFERINDLVLQCGSMGFWNHELQRRYMTRRKIRTMIRRQIIIYNKERGIDNTKAITKFNEAFHEDDNDTTSTIETSEHDIIDRFVAQKYSFVTLEHLFPALKMFVFGLTLATGVFFVELVMNSYFSHNIVE